MKEGNSAEKIRDKMRRELLREPAPEDRQRERIEGEIFRGLGRNLEKASDYISDEQRKAIIDSFEGGQYKNTIDLIVQACEGIDPDKSFPLRSLAGSIGIVYLGEFKLY